MSTDGVARLWNDENGEMIFQFNYNGGLVQSVLVDVEEQVVLAAMQDAVIRVFNLSDPIPQARSAPCSACYCCVFYCIFSSLLFQKSIHTWPCRIEKKSCISQVRNGKHGQSVPRHTVQILWSH